MNEFTGTLKPDVSFTATGKAIISIVVNEKMDALRMVDDLKCCEKLTIKVGKYKEKRSLDQNGYFWKLCNELSEKLEIPPKELYREYIKDVGGNYEITPIKTEAVEKWIEIWQNNGVGFVSEDLGESKIQGYHNVRNFYGSSTYTTSQMARLLKLIIADCKENGINTLTAEELIRMGM